MKISFIPFCIFLLSACLISNTSAGQNPSPIKPITTEKHSVQLELLDKYLFYQNNLSFLNKLKLEQCESELFLVKESTLKDFRFNRNESNTNFLYKLDKLLIRHNVNRINELFPRFDPNPPPLPSAKYSLEVFFPSNTNFIEVNNKLVSTLDELGYHERIYFSTKNGFALMTQIEQFDEDGKSISGKQRWSNEVTWSLDISFMDYLKALFKPKTGQYRMFVFWVATSPLVFSDNPEFKTNAFYVDKLKTGSTSINLESMTEVTNDTKIYGTVLIYEFSKNQYEDESKLTSRSLFTGREHLVKSKLFKKLARGPR